ncbi:hypothetical protein C8R47DRAFT_213916 [Mycena vitilis]|nr:hypothetical protein C8R47DRAFT_213916 [Mycena vitilis]
MRSGSFMRWIKRIFRRRRSYILKQSISESTDSDSSLPYRLARPARLSETTRRWLLSDSNRQSVSNRYDTRMVHRHSVFPQYIQAYNEDILRLIFEHCSIPTLLSASRVCKEWLFPAQMELFADIPSRRLPRRQPRWGELASALDCSPRLRGYIRCLRIAPSETHDIYHYRWLRLLPPDRLVRLQLYGYPYPTEAVCAALTDILVASPAFFSLRHLIVCSPALSALQSNLFNPQLEQLSIIFIRGERPTLRPHVFAALQWLSIKAWDVIEEIPLILRACSASLRRFDLRINSAINMIPDSDGYSRLREALEGLSQLEHLYLAWAENTPTPFLDTLALPRLKHLRAGAGLHTGAFFVNLPPVLETLYLEHRNIVDVRAMIAGVRGHPTLETFTLAPYRAFREFPTLAAASKQFRCTFVAARESQSAELLTHCFGD